VKGHPCPPPEHSPTARDYPCGRELKPFDQQRLKHGWKLISGGALRHLGGNFEAIRIQPGRTFDLV
jgi:hypothetical protein